MTNVPHWPFFDASLSFFQQSGRKGLSTSSSSLFPCKLHIFVDIQTCTLASHQTLSDTFSFLKLCMCYVPLETSYLYLLKALTCLISLGAFCLFLQQLLMNFFSSKPFHLFQVSPKASCALSHFSNASHLSLLKLLTPFLKPLTLRKLFIVYLKNNLR